MMTPIRKETIRLLWLNYSGYQIVEELAQKYDIGESQQALMPQAIAKIRAEIADFRARAPELAGTCFARGEDWRTVIKKFEEVGLIPSIEYVGICHRASAKVEQAESEPEPVVPVIDSLARNNEALNQQLIDAALSANPHDPTLLSLCDKYRLIAPHMSRSKSNYN